MTHSMTCLLTFLKSLFLYKHAIYSINNNTCYNTPHQNRLQSLTFMSIDAD